MKKFKTFISLVITVAMVMTLLVTVVSANNGKSDKHYITLMGDSVAVGYGLDQETVWSSELRTRDDGVTRYYFNRPLGDSVVVPNSYLGWVARGLGIDTSDPLNVPFVYNESRCGFRSVEQLRLLDPAYDQERSTDTYGTETILNTYSGMTSAEKKYLYENATRHVANSKLVILNLGSNDVSLALTEIGPLRLEEILAEEEKTISVRGLLERTKSVLKQGGDLTSILVTAIGWAETVGAVPETIAAYSSAMIEGITTWMDVYKRLVAKIYEINPDVTIVNVGFYNAFKEMKLTDVSLFNIGSLMEFGSILADNYMQSLEPFANNDQYDYRYVDVRAVPLNGFSTSILGALLSGKLDQFGAEYTEQIHPSPEGHQWIADQILAVLGDDFTLNLEGVTPDPAPVIPGSELYADVHSTDWFYEMVKYVTENGYMNGIGDNLFAPNANLSRAMVAQILYAMEGKPSVTEAGTFSDVVQGDWFADAVNWAASQGVVAGFENGTFQPNVDVTREQLAVILNSYAKMKEKDGTVTADLTGFVDAAQISEWAVSGVRWAAEKGIISGKPGNILDPKGTATRAEMATMIMNLKSKVL